MKRAFNVDTSELVSFRTGGIARELAVAETRQELLDVLSEADSSDRPFVFLGNGTNTLFTDDFYDGTVIMLGEAFERVDINPDAGGALVTCGAACLLSGAAKAAAANSLTGLEFAAGIPGSAGGGVFMNAGAYGGEIKDVLQAVELVTGPDPAAEPGASGGGERRLVTIPASELELGYRTSRLASTREIIVSAVFYLRDGVQKDIDGKIRELAVRRQEKQPLDKPSAGSFFKRPPGDYAGRLIEAAGLRGLTVGGAQVSEKHCGFVINRGTATARDIVDLMHIVQNTVFDKFGVHLEPEIRMISNEYTSGSAET